MKFVQTITLAAVSMIAMSMMAGEKIAVGILKYGDKRSHADGVCEALSYEKDFAPEIVRDVTPETLKKFKAVIWPQMDLGVVKDTPAYMAYYRWFPIVKQWVEEGGGLMVTHDAVGYKGHAPLFSEIAKGSFHDSAGREPFLAEIVVSREKPFTASLRQGDRIPLSYFDYVTLELGPKGKILARGVEKTGDTAKSSGPVIAYGQVGKGRYIANGTIPGLLDNDAVPPSGAEKQLLLDCVLYLAGRVADPAPESPDFGAERPLGEKSVNLLFNGGMEKLDASGKPYHALCSNAGSALPDWGVTDKERHSGENGLRLTLKAFKSVDDPAGGKGTIGTVFGDALYGAYGEKTYVISPKTGEYEFSCWIKGDKTNVRQPTVLVLIYAWKSVDGKLTRETIVPKNAEFAVVPEWRKHAVRFYLEGFTRVAPAVTIGGTEKNIPRKTITGELHPRTDIPVGTTIYLDDASLVSLGAVDHSALNVDKVRAAAEKRVQAEWRDTNGASWLARLFGGGENDGASVPPLEKVRFGDSVEADTETLASPNYDPWPENWKTVSLNGVWKIKKLPGSDANPENDAGSVQGFWKADYVDSGWATRSVPGTWDTEDKPLSPLAREYDLDRSGAFTGIGWYRTAFAAPEKTSGKRLVLRFDRVHYEATVYLNNRKIGVNRGGNRPFEFDVTDTVKPGDNILAVRVSRPAGKTKYIIGDKRLGGILGDVSLQERPAIYASALFIDPKVATSSLSVRMEVMNASGSEQARRFSLSVAPSAADRRLDREQGAPRTFDLGKQTLKPGLNALDFSVKLDRPITWSPDCPYLYDLTVGADGETIGRDRFGFREFTVKENRYLLNGKPFFPKGIVFDFPTACPGILSDRENIFRRLLAAHKRWGVNMLFPQGEQLFCPRAFYDICDELGILINEWQGATAQKIVTTSALFDDADTTARFRYLYNHPSFAMYTVGNESREKEFIGPINHVYDLVKKIDGQKRPVCAVSGGAPHVYKFKEDTCDVHAYPGGIYGHPLDTREIFEDANRSVWSAHGKALPVGNWEMGGAKIAAVEKQYRLGKKLFAAPKLDKEALVQAIVQFDTGYHMPAGLRWMALYGLRRYCEEAPRKLEKDDDFAALREERPNDLRDRESFWAAKYYCEWSTKNQLDDCRRLGDLMRGGFGINMGRAYSLFYVRGADGKLRVVPSSPWFAPWDLAGGTLTASELYSTYKRGYNSRFICADVFAKNVFSGGKLEMTLYAINDTQENATAWDVRVVILDKAGKVLADKTANVGAVDAMKRNLVPFVYDVPADLPSGFYDVRLYLCQDNKVISDNFYEFFALNDKDLDEKIDAGSRRVAVYDVSNRKVTTAGILERLGVKFDRLKDFGKLGDYDVLMIGAESMDSAVIANGKAIREWVKNGGRLVQFEQYSPNNLSWLPQLSIIKRIGGNVGSLIVAEHPVFAKINASENWDTWNGRLERTSRGGKQGGIFTALISPLNKTMLALGCQDTPRATDAAVQMLISDVKLGKGVALISQPAATFRYGADSVATKYIQNCVKYVLSDESRFAEPISGLNVENVDYRRCGYLDLSKQAKRALSVDDAWMATLDQGIKACGDSRFKLPAPCQAARIDRKVEFSLPADMAYMDPVWEAEKQAKDHDQGALLKNRVDNLFILAALPEGNAANGSAAARLTLRYKDGTTASRELFVGEDIGAANAVSDLDNAKYVGGGLYVTRWQAPKTDVPVETVIIEPLTDKGLILGGVTATLIRDKVHGL